MAVIDFPFPSKKVSASGLTIPKAREIAIAIQSGSLSYVKLFECRVLDTGCESVIFDAEVELGQKNNVYEIEKIERIAVVFDPKDEITPEVLFFRDNFPRTPHTNLRNDDYISPCLYDLPFSEIKLYLTPARFIERIRQWLADTARGKLHGADQPLEPLFLEPKQLIIPFDLFDSFNPDNPPKFEVYLTKVNNLYTYIAERENLEGDRRLRFTALVLRCSPQVHGVIHRKPKNLLELHAFTSATGFDLLNSVRTILQKLHTEGSLPKLQDNCFMLVVAFPKTRDKGGRIEATDIWGFLSAESIKKVGEEIGVWKESGGYLGMLMSLDQTKKGENISLEMCRTMYSFSKEMAAAQNGLASSENKKICMIGVGALGSHVFLNLVRAGFGNWTLVDNDLLLPHNLARHALGRRAVGFSKAKCLALMVNHMIDGLLVAQPIIRDILRPSQYNEDLKKALSAADIILDCSATLSVARFIALDLPSSSRRISLFLAPSGNDSVLLSEDSKREIPLDQIEMQYYRLLINEKELEGHLSASERQLRYGNSCSDINSSMSQELVVLHSAIGSRSLRKAINDDVSRITIWRANPDDLSVRSHSFSPIKMTEVKTGSWSIYFDEWLLNKIFAARVAKLPNETGGVLVGSFDMQRKIVYITDTLFSPPDSKEWPTVYIRGCQGLAQRMKEIGDMTFERLEYVGEWHSHTGGSCSPSGEDKQAFAWLSDMRIPDGLPAIMLIAADKKSAIYLGSMI